MIELLPFQEGQLYTASELSKYFKVHPATIGRWRERGLIDAIGLPPTADSVAKKHNKFSIRYSGQAVIAFCSLQCEHLDRGCSEEGQNS